MSNTARTNNNRAAENQVKEKPAEESRAKENRAEGNRMEERAANTHPAVDTRPVDTRPKVSSIDEDEEYIPPARELPARARDRAGPLRDDGDAPQRRAADAQHYFSRHGAHCVAVHRSD